MKVIHSFEELQAIEETMTYALGNFDGLHRGHQSIIDEAVKQAHSQGGVSLVITFDGHPLTLLAPGKAPKCITGQEDWCQLLEQSGVDSVLALTVTREVLSMPAPDFVKAITAHNKVQAIVVGKNFTFGAKGAGNPDLLAELLRGTSVQVLVKDLLQDKGEKTISSTAIRQAIQQGHMEEAEAMLGRPFQFKGQVILGDQRGRTLGFPTMNFRLPDWLVVPPDGVYVNRVCIGGQWYGGVGNVGDNPTFTNQYHRCEVHVFDFNQDVYGQEVTVQFLHYIRGEVKFDSLDALMEQMNQDEEEARRILEDRSF